jgi:signal transduction histidine kinase
VRSKLIAVLLIPAMAFLVLASVSIASSVRNAQQFGQGAKLAELGREVTGLVHELQQERDLTIGHISSGRSKQFQSQLEQQITATGKAIDDYRKAELPLYDDIKGMRPAFDAIRRDIYELPSLRGTVAQSGLTESAVFAEYSSVIADILRLIPEISERSGSDELTNRVSALEAISTAKELSSQERGMLLGIALRKGYSFGEFQDFQALLAREKAALDRFTNEASGADRVLFADTVKGQAVLAVLRIEEAAANRLGNSSDLDINPDQWYSSSTTKIELMRSVEADLLDNVIFRGNELSADAQRQALVNGMLIAVTLAVALFTSLAVARSMARSLQRLRASALDVAENRLPEAIQRLRTTESGGLDLRVQPIGIDSRDEIGEVARAFDAVHEEAIRLATEQAVLRSNVNAMFVNLSRRSQSLVERQLRLIDELEDREQDPDQLENLFKLDHLATRMRRNDESLLVLAGSESTRRWSAPVPLSDVLLAATAEVEQYTRITQTTVSNVSVAGHAVSDLVHLLAELLENATSFSSPTTNVVLTGRAIRGGTEAMIEIEDSGLGMTPEALADANERLAEPPIIDVSVSQRMGLFVVSRLAQRHDITVQLRESPRGGVTALAWLPPSLIGNAGGIPAATGPRSELGAGRVEGRDLDSAIAARALPGPQDADEQPADDAADIEPAPLPRRGTTQSQPAVPSQPQPRPAPAAPARGPSTGNAGEKAPIQPGQPVQPGVPTGPAQAPKPPMPIAAAGADAPAAGHDAPADAVNGRSNPAGRPSKDEALPGTTYGPPDSTPPDSALPDSALPDSALPDSALPNSALPNSALPNSALPNSTLPIYESVSEWFRIRQPGERTAPVATPAPAYVAGQPAPPAPVAALGLGEEPAAPTPTLQPAATAPETGPEPAVPAAEGTAATPAAASVASESITEAIEAITETGADVDDEAVAVPADWRSPGDEGWAAAAAAAYEPVSGGTTRAGLPIRVPMAHFVPGVAEPPAATPHRPTAPAAAASTRTPETVRGVLTSYYQGVRQAREAAEDRATKHIADEQQENS